MAYDTGEWGARLGDPNTNVGLRKHVDRRLNGMRAQRGGYEPAWMEISRFCQATVNRHLAGYVGNNGVAATSGTVSISQGNRLNTKLLDSRAVWASEVLGNGMYSGLTAPSRPWFKLKISGDAGQQKAVKVYLNEVERRIYELFSSTNFYTSIKSGYRELGQFGIEGGVMERHWRVGMICHPLVAGEFWVAQGDDGTVDTLYRRTDMTTLQHYRRFLRGRRPEDALPRQIVEAYNSGQYDRLFCVYQAIELNDVYDPSRMDGRDKPWRSVYWSPFCDARELESEQKALLEVAGFNSKPFWSPRWETTGGGDPYSPTSPGFNGLADVRQLQLQALRKQQAIDFTVKPALAGPATLNNISAALQPGRITAMAQVDKSSFFPIWEINPVALNAIREDKEETAQAVDRSFYANLFMAITNMQGIQPRNIEEIAKRNEEQLTQLGPVVERVNQEKLEVAIDRAFDILQSSGALGDLEVPSELEGQKVDTEFVSVLAQAQRLVGLGGIERTFGFAASIAQTHPEALDKLDADQAMDEYGDITGIPANILRSDDEVQAIRQARAQQQQQAAAAEQAAQLAPAMKQGVEAAQLLYNTPGSSGSLADRLLGA